jgi:rhamnosyl/mannosyltransferase
VTHVGKFYPPHMGGIETHLEALCQQLRDRFDVSVVAANHQAGASVEVRAGIPVRRLATPFALGNAPVSPFLAAAVRDARPDLVHIHLPHPAGVLGLLASGYRGPVIVTYHSDVVRQWLWNAAFRPFLDHVLRRADAIIVTSPKYLESSVVLRRHRSRCVVVPYGIPLDRFASADVDAVLAIRARYGPRIVLAVGRLVYYKGFEFLIRAAPSIKARVVLIGDGPLRGELQRLAHDVAATSVTFAGEIQNEMAAPFFRAADLLAFPSIARSEAFGIVQLEAMASGTPVVNTSLASGVPWVSLHGITGLTVPPRDPDALASAINMLLDDEALRRGLSRAAVARVQAEFTVERMGERVAALYDRSLDRNTIPELAVTSA